MHRKYISGGHEQNLLKTMTCAQTAKPSHNNHHAVQNEVSALTCELCGKVPATQAQTHVENGVKRVLYRCDACANLVASPPKLDRPCAQCGQREGEIKLTRVRTQGRVVTYVCEPCATGR